MHEMLDQLLKRNHRACYLKFISLIYEIEIKTIAEVGVFQGKNAQVLREQFPDAHLYLIDPWVPSPSYLNGNSAVSKEINVYQKGLKRVRELFKNDSQVTVIQANSQKAPSLLPKSLDLVFIDANHNYTNIKQDILTYFPLVRQGGILSGHNYGRKRLPGVKRAVQELFQNHFLLGQDEVWLHIKKCRFGALPL